MAWWLAQNLVVTAALALVVAAICRATRLGPVIRHALWLVVLIKFVTPPLVVWPWAVPDPLQLAAIEWGTAEVPPALVTGDAIIDYGDFDAGSVQEADLPAMPPSASLILAAGRAVASALPWVLGIWLVGSLALLALETLRILRLFLLARRGAAASPDFEARVAGLAARLGVGPVETRVVPGSAPPIVWGIRRPQLLWPTSLPAPMSAACLDGLLLHELAHVRRRDHLVGWIELAAGIAWWWNPLFWYVRSELREQAELACDAWVVSSLPDGRRAYAESLLAISGAALGRTPSLAAVGVRATSRRLLERRLVMIMQGRAPVRLTWAGVLSLSIVALATLPGWAAVQTSEPPPPPPVPVVVQEPPPPPVRIVVPMRPPAPPTPVVTPQDPPSPRARLVRPVVVPPTSRGGAVPSVVAPPAVPVVALETPKGQQVQGGSIEGTVTDASEAPVAGVTVIVDSDDLMRPMVAVTDVAGSYQFPGVPPSAYVMSFELAGYKKVVRTGIIIQTGFQAEVNAQLEARTDAPPPPPLPAAGVAVIDEFQTARVSIQREAEARIESRRRELVVTLEALIREYTSAGRNEEAAALRDFLASGMPGVGGTRIGGR